jgi:hypothetical protein
MLLCNWKVDNGTEPVLRRGIAMRAVILCLPKGGSDRGFYIEIQGIRMYIVSFSENQT